jgi:hypothetical protein
MEGDRTKQSEAELPDQWHLALFKYWSKRCIKRAPQLCAWWQERHHPPLVGIGRSPSSRNVPQPAYPKGEGHFYLEISSTNSNEFSKIKSAS